MAGKEQPTNKWIVLAMITAILTGAIGIPFVAMPVLFSSINKELNLTLAQTGMVWGALPVGVALFSLPGGLLGDRFGFHKIIGVGCFIIALTNAFRGITNDAITLTIAMLLCGISLAAVVPNLPKVASLYFPPRQLGLALGILNAGFSLGGILATALGAIVILPLVGSWRNVLFSYSAICVVLGIGWFSVVSKKEPSQTAEDTEVTVGRVSFRESFGAIVRVKDMWLLIIVNLMLVGSFIAMLGYLPIYLENTGMTKSAGDTVTSTIFIAGMLGTIVIPALSDRIGARKITVIVCVGVTVICTYLISLSVGVSLWLLIPLIGFAVQSAIALFFAIILEMKEIGPIYGGSAIGILIAGQNVGGFLLPIIGGNLAELNQSWPFAFWAILIFVTIPCLFLVRETGRK